MANKFLSQKLQQISRLVDKEYSAVEVADPNEQVFAVSVSSTMIENELRKQGVDFRAGAGSTLQREIIKLASGNKLIDVINTPQGKALVSGVEGRKAIEQIIETAINQTNIDKDSLTIGNVGEVPEQQIATNISSSLQDFSTRAVKAAEFSANIKGFANFRGTISERDLRSDELQELIVDIKATVESVYSSKSKTARKTVNVEIIESTKTNAKRKSAINRQLKQIRKKAQSLIEREFQNLASMNLSNSFEDETSDMVGKSFKGISTNKKERSKSKKRAVKKGSKRDKKHALKKPNFQFQVRNKQGQFMKPEGLIPLINAVLKDRIRQNMGKGRAVQILNYRTGRFARNVKVTGITQPRRNQIQAFYTYMENPYATFEPDGAHTAMTGIVSRDPRILIGKSIRLAARRFLGKALKITVRKE